MVVGYETLCLTLGLACGYSLTFGLAYMIEIDVDLLIAYPILCGLNFGYTFFLSFSQF